MLKKYFVTGTDTDVGKTLVICSLIHAFKKENQSVMAIKPIAAGCELIDGQLKNSDALEIIQSLDDNVSYQMINPITLRSAIAPHIAATEEQTQLSVKYLQEQSNTSQFDQDYLLVEGAGGWLVPLNETETLADFVVAESLEVILVVGMKLGCINHALLTIKNIESRGVKLAGWVANCINKEMMVLDENIQTLCKRINAPLLGIIPYLTEAGDLDQKNRIKEASTYVNITPLIE
ncbi:MAG: dethiobiotin synthetase [Polaribacter sp.]|jgi:dethiobiotin synthetase